nr:hypothetical protein [uncultured Desulfobacter sp.]
MNNTDEKTDKKFLTVLFFWENYQSCMTYQKKGKLQPNCKAAIPVRVNSGQR